MRNGRERRRFLSSIGALVDWAVPRTAPIGKLKSLVTVQMSFSMKPAVTAAFPRILRRAPHATRPHDGSIGLCRAFPMCPCQTKSKNTETKRTDHMFLGALIRSQVNPRPRPGTHKVRQFRESRPLDLTGLKHDLRRGIQTQSLEGSKTRRPLGVFASLSLRDEVYRSQPEDSTQHEPRKISGRDWEHHPCRMGIADFSAKRRPL